MKTITRKFTIYQVDELRKEIQLAVLEKYRLINVESDIWNGPWHEQITEGFKKHLEELGYDDVKILFNGFYSQGDGACFTANVNIQKWLDAHKLAKKYISTYKNSENLSITISHTYRYYFATSTDVDYELYEDMPVLERQAGDIVELITNERKELGNSLYGTLRKGYEEETSDDAVINTLKVNEFEFLANGDLFNY